MDFFTPERFERLRTLTRGGRPFVFDDGDLRTLHFDEYVVQSAMRISDPYALVIPYTQAMTGFGVFQPQPAHVLMVGLGGGSLAKFCYRQLPHTRLTVLENDADVIALREQFMVPPDDARLRVLHADAADFIATQDNATAEVILLDGFDQEGGPPTLCSADFFAHCRRVLPEGGVLVANMADEENTIAGMVREAQAHFGLACIGWFKVGQENSHLLVAVRDSAAQEDGNGAHAAAVQAGLERLRNEHGLQLVYPCPQLTPSERQLAANQPPAR